MCGKSGSNWAFWAGSDTSGSAPFRVGHAGELIATNATITGVVNASSGTIGDFYIGTGADGLHSDDLKLVYDRIIFNVSGTEVELIGSNMVGYSGGKGLSINKGLKVIGSLDLTDGSYIYMSGTSCVRGWVKYQKSLTDARYMRFMNGLLVEEANSIPDGDFVGQIN